MPRLVITARIKSEARVRMFHECAARNKSRAENCDDFYCFTAEWALNISSHAHMSPGVFFLASAGSSRHLERAEAHFAVRFFPSRCD